MIYKILKFPDARLKQKASQVIDFNEELLHIVNNMYETMYAYKGVGLAATQVDIHQCIIVTCVDDVERTFINPVFGVVGNDFQKYTEGCLSFPGMKVEKIRHDTIQVNYQDIFGNFKEITCDGLLAVCVQHEIAHINGVTFIDDLSQFKRTRLLEKYL